MKPEKDDLEVEAAEPPETEENDADDAEQSDEEILALAHERFKQCVEAEQNIRQLALEDLKFGAGDQWPANIKQAREQKKRPCLTINRLPQFIRQITNDIRQNRPAIKVSPVDDKADVDTAKILQGLIRHIEYASDADVAYDTAVDGAVRAGFGFFRVITEYSDEQSFDQEIRLKRVPNQFTVYLDPSYQQPDGSDAEFGFIFEDLTHKSYDEQFPQSQGAKNGEGEWDAIGADMPEWASKDSVRVAEYFYKTYRNATILLLSDKSTVEKSEFEESLKDPAIAAYVQQNQIQILDKRQTKICEVKWAKIAAKEVLEKKDWAGKYIPIIPVLGEELNIDGKRHLEGVIRHAKDPQRMSNYWKSTEAETIALAPKAPYIIAEGQVEGYEKIWENANTENFAYLPYKPKALNQVPLPPPQRQTYEPAVQAISQSAMMAAEDMKATTGIFDDALGAGGNEKSGVAIQRRTNQAQKSNFHFVDNLSRSIRHCGRILVDLIPKIYDTERAARILGEDGSEEIVMLNAVFQKDGQTKKYDLSLGKYDVTVSTGPSYETKRQESVASMLDLAKVLPQLGQVAPDLLVAQMDWGMAKEISERLKKTLAPNLTDDGKGQAQLPPQAQAQMQQMNQMIEQLTNELKAKNQIIDQKQVEFEQKKALLELQLKSDAAIALAKLQSNEAIEVLGHQMAEMETRFQAALQAQSQMQNQSSQAQPSGPQGAATPAPQQQPPIGGPSPS